MGFSDVPLSIWLWLFIMWISLFLYLVIIYIIVSSRKKSSFYRTPFITITILFAINDILMFLTSQFVMRPRKYNLFFVYSPTENSLFIHVQYFWQTWLRQTTYFVYIVMAVNRLTVFIIPIHYDGIWKTKNILTSYFLLNIGSFVFLLWLFGGDHTFGLCPQKEHKEVLLLNPDDDLLQKDMVYDVILVLICLLVSTTCYSIAFSRMKQIGTQFIKLNERNLVICGILSFLMFIPNVCCSISLYIGDIYNNDILFNFGAENWAQTAELMSMSQPWSILITCPQIRKELVERMLNIRKKRSSIAPADFTAMYNGRKATIAS